MSAPFVVAPDRFAAWARTRGVALPYPIDITRVDAAGADVPADVAQLQRLAAVCEGARSVVSSVVVVPGGGDRVAVAVAAERSAALVCIDDNEVSVTATAPDQLVASLAARLPDLPGLAQVPIQLPERAWNDLLQQVATGPSLRSITAALHGVGIGEHLTAELLAAKDHPVPIGLLGASARAGVGVPLQRGPTLASWFAYPNGAMLATLLAPRRGGPRVVHVEPYTPAAAVRALAQALPAAHRAAGRE